MRTYDIYSNDKLVGAIMTKSDAEAVSDGCSKYKLQPDKDNVTAVLRQMKLSNCIECRKEFDHINSICIDICDSCLVEKEGKPLAALKREYGN